MTLFIFNFIIIPIIVPSYLLRHAKKAKLNKGFTPNDLNEIYNDTPTKTIS